MESSLTVQTSSGNYVVTVGAGIRKKISSYLPKSYESIYIVSDQKVADLYMEDVKANFPSFQQVESYVVPNGEASKNIDQYYQLITDALEKGLNRHSLVIALGGGVIGDLVGFFASTFMRGIDFVQMPTTILAHDSSVGGKVGINHAYGKNLIGSFYPPVAVIYDVETLTSLPQREVRSGYAEVVKHGFLRDSAFLTDVIRTDLNKPLSQQTLKEHLLQGIQVKAEVVEKDERESHHRMFLNLGHTLGHALESELGYGVWTHGEAVAVGMLFALKVSEKTFEVKLSYQELLQWLKHNNYPLSLPDVKVASLLEKMKKDKKSRDNHVQMVLLKQIGEPIIQKMDEGSLCRDLEDFLGELVQQND
ncbi:3-dehydroquinate synthase [Radiobacillus kanasensis]|uniref:3-dehydroquinate synthase n=1 Tax=Radiobacillus kanasensis TaxID=2844358 RepID=UPI001E5091AE|nr:3-dehydroquinate synthase [Radiobacillus kanasensis]UFT97622.1 3-dehydroquinate synthase [Radiobacillus kanasensis]